MDIDEKAIITAAYPDPEVFKKRFIQVYGTDFGLNADLLVRAFQSGIQAVECFRWWTWKRDGDYNEYAETICRSPPADLIDVNWTNCSATRSA